MLLKFARHKIFKLVGIQFVIKILFANSMLKARKIDTEGKPKAALSIIASGIAQIMGSNAPNTKISIC